MRRIAGNSVATAGGRSTRLLLLLLFVTHRLRTSLGSNDSPPIVEDPEYNSVHPDLRGFLMDVVAHRVNASESIVDFKFDLNRVHVISKSVRIPIVKKGIMYWMNRDHRVQDNWALLYAQKLAIQNKVPLHVVYCRPPIIVRDLYRQYTFMCEGLKKVERECRTLDIEFHFLIGDALETISHFVRTHTMGAIIVDFSPLREDINILKRLNIAMGSEIPVIHTDAHNIIPCWTLAEKQLGANRLKLRKRMHVMHQTYLTEFPPVIKHPYTAYPKARPIDWEKSNSNVEIDYGIQTLSNYKAGYIPAMSALNDFLKQKLVNYELNRNDPLIDGLSNLSPWLHFGHISAQRVLLEVQRLNDIHPKNVFVFKEEVLNRRELLENFCYYNSNYDNIEGGPTWAQDSINRHRNDTREYLYTRREFEEGQIFDELWNASHNQMKMEGKTHRYLRPYWAKKILEYSKTPEEAIATAIYLNNKYSLDGNDPAGYGGVLWAMTGLYDQKCKERSIFGRVRHLDSTSIRAKFDDDSFIRKYKGTFREKETGTN